MDSEQHSPTARGTWGATLGVAALALFIRLWFIAETRDVPWFRTPAPGTDVDLHWLGARELRRGMVPHFALAEMSAPMHAWIIAIEQVVLGESHLALRIACVPVGVLTVAIVHRLALGATGSRRVAGAVGFFAACLPTLVYFDTVPFKVSFEVLMVASALAVAMVLRRVTDERRRIAFGALLGLLLSALCLSQLNAIGESAALFLVLALDRKATRRERLTALVPAAAVVALCLGAFSMRDRMGERMAATFLPQAGIHLREGFRPDRTGPGVVPGVGGLGRDHVFTARIVAERAIGRALTPAEANAYHVRVALRSIADHPGMTARSIAAKAQMFFSDAEQQVHGNSFEQFRQTAFALRAPIGFGTLVVLAALGVVRLGENRETRALALLGAMVAAEFAVNVAGQVTSRYRLHSVVPMLLLSGYGMLLVAQRWKSRGKRRVSTPLAVAIAAAAIAYGPLRDDAQTRSIPLDALDAMSLGAEAILDELSAIHETGLEASLSRVRLLMLLRRDSEAMAELGPWVDDAGAVDIRAARPWLDYLILLGQYEKAGSFVERMTRLDPALGSQLRYGRDPLLQWALDALVLHRPSAALP